MWEKAKKRYEADEKIGEGTYSEIFRGVDTKTGSLVALKKMRIKKYEEGMPAHVVRELECAKVLKPKYVVRLIEFYAKEGGIVLVYEYMPSDLHTVISALTKPLMESQIKAYLFMILRSVAYCHRRRIMHRDIKPSNILISGDGVLKLGDFGLGKVIVKGGLNHTLEVGTRWYKAPEILFGDKSYTGAIDMWAVGCVLAELIEGVPIFSGINDLDQLARIIKVMGIPTEEVWPKIRELPDYGKMCWPESSGAAPGIGSVLTRASKSALSLLSRMLVYDPEKRISAKDALQHPYFFESPIPADLSALPFIPRE